ncbi:MAG: hypothetical protein CL820_05230 [Croceicoccus sp.]|nr:hypothetical protein [Croceicoccus sp.]
MGKPARGMGSYEIRRSTRRARLSASEGTGPALFQVEPLNSAKGVRIMANGEKKADVARAIIAHALNVTADCLAEQPQRGMQTRTRNLGTFGAMHWVQAGERETVDVWQDKKLFSATRYLNSDSWELISFKRGDWESGFLCAA